MITLDTVWRGFADMDAALKRAMVQADLAAREIVAVASAELIRDAMANFEGAHRKGEAHVGGNKPNIVTGNLRRSIRGSGIARGAWGEYKQTVGPTTVYGRAVEMGRPGRSRAFPYFGPAAAGVRVRMDGISTLIWSKYLKF